MVDVAAHIAYWRGGADEDWQVADDLMRLGRVRHGLFFAHLALEKILKAHVCRATRDVPPRLHLLLRLAERTGIGFSEVQREFLARFDRHHLAGRYPDSVPLPLDAEGAQREMKQALEILNWLIQQL
jgi:HEPN domain-containing protein